MILYFILAITFGIAIGVLYKNHKIKAAAKKGLFLYIDGELYTVKKELK